MEETLLDTLRRDVETLPVAVIVADLTTYQVVVANDAAAKLFRRPSAGAMHGMDATTYLDPRDRPASEAAYAALRTRLVDGYQARRRAVLPDGTELELTVWGRRVEVQGRSFGFWILARDNESGLIGGPIRSADVAVALTDHDWQLDFVSTGSRLIGEKDVDLVGTPLLGLVHPSAANEFLAATSHAVTERLAVTFGTRLRTGRNKWQDRSCLVVPMCGHAPPRLGVVIAPIAESSAGETTRERLALEVHRALVEGRSAQVVRALPTVISAHPATPRLSARELEVLARVVAGEDTEQIARSVYLSASTVRNHLTGIYRKFRVHSRPELLAALLRAATAADH